MSYSSIGSDNTTLFHQLFSIRLPNYFLGDRYAWFIRENILKAIIPGSEQLFVDHLSEYFHEFPAIFLFIIVQIKIAASVYSAKDVLQHDWIYHLYNCMLIADVIPNRTIYPILTSRLLMTISEDLK